MDYDSKKLFTVTEHEGYRVIVDEEFSVALGLLVVYDSTTIGGIVRNDEDPNRHNFGGFPFVPGQASTMLAYYEADDVQEIYDKIVDFHKTISKIINIIKDNEK